MEKGTASPALEDATESSWADAQEDSPLIAQILGVATLEFGVIFHVSLLIAEILLEPLLTPLGRPYRVSSSA